LDQALGKIAAGAKRPAGPTRPQLEHWLGGKDELATSDTPWATFLSSGLRTAAEMKAAHGEFKAQVMAARRAPDGSIINFEAKGLKVVDKFTSMPTEKLNGGGLSGSGTLKRQLTEELNGFLTARMRWDIDTAALGDYRHHRPLHVQSWWCNQISAGPALASAWLRACPLVSSHMDTFQMRAALSIYLGTQQQ